MKGNEPKAGDRLKTAVQIFKSFLPKDTYAVNDKSVEHIYGNNVEVAFNDEIAMLDCYDGINGAFAVYKRSGFMYVIISESDRIVNRHLFSLADQGDLFDEWLFRKLRELGFKKDGEMETTEREEESPQKRYEQMRLF